MLQRLDAIPFDAPALIIDVRDIRTQTYLKLAELAETVRLYEQGQKDAAMSLVQTDVGQHYMEQ